MNLEAIAALLGHQTKTMTMAKTKTNAKIPISQYIPVKEKVLVEITFHSQGCIGSP